MKKYITADNLLCFERDVQVPESSKWDVEVEKRFVLTFGTVPSQKRKNNDTRTKLCCAAFSLDAYSEAEAERIWSGYEFRFASRKIRGNGRSPFAMTSSNWREADMSSSSREGPVCGGR